MPYNGVLIALLSVMLVSYQKIIIIDDGNIDLLPVLTSVFLFCYYFAELLYDCKKIYLLNRGLMLSVLLNITLLLIMLYSTTPDNFQAQSYFQAYQHIYYPTRLYVLCFLGAILIKLSELFSDSLIPRFISIQQHGFKIRILNQAYSDQNSNLRYYLNSVFSKYVISVLSQTVVFYIIYSYLQVETFKEPISYWFGYLGLNIGLLAVFFALRYLKANFKIFDNSDFDIPKYYYYMTILCITLLINSHSICYKLVELPWYGVVSASGIMFPMTFLFADTVAEHYGYAASRILIWSTLIAQFVFVSFTFVIRLMPSDMNNIYNQSFEYLFQNLIPRQLLAATVSVFFSFFIFSFLISILKTNLQNKSFWKRSLIANMLAKAVLCTFSYFILYSGRFSPEYIISIIWHTWLLKMFIALIGTFVLTIPLVYYLKINDQRAYLYNEKYNPFNMQVQFAKSQNL